MRLVALMVATTATASSAAASPLEDTTVGGAVFTGPTQGHATSIYLNPAALGFSGRGWHFFMSGNVRLSSLSIDRQVVDPSNSSALTDGPSVST
jgi:hypothetical protein